MNVEDLELGDVVYAARLIVDDGDKLGLFRSSVPDDSGISVLSGTNRIEYAIAVVSIEGNDGILADNPAEVVSDPESISVRRIRVRKYLPQIVQKLLVVIRRSANINDLTVESHQRGKDRSHKRISFKRRFLENNILHY